MGWWGIEDESAPSLLDSLGRGALVIGDGPADIMYAAVEKIVEEYEREWDRKPRLRELRAVLNFVAPSELEQ
jgi:hypothetical protein